MEQAHGTWGAKEKIVCPVCKKELVALKSRNQKHCSKKCAQIARRRKTEKTICPICKKEFFYYARRRQTYCSKACAGVGRRSGVNWLSKPRQIRRITKNGRVVAISRYLIGKKIGRHLSSKEIAHHVDMDNSKDKIENLYLCENITEHMAVHKSLDKLVKGLLEDNIIQFKNGKYERSDKSGANIQNVGRKVDFVSKRFMRSKHSAP